MSKSALAGPAKGLARDLGPRGITDNYIHPDPIETDMNPQDAESAIVGLNNMVLPSFGTAEEVAELVTFVAGPNASYSTGANLNIDGGFTS